ncbi:LysE family translocator [Campylobacter sp. RM16188]|uniref:LysE family translocator n=1 Tax=Campylobacter sp. RM16188 TaxID=1705725 RepID=UPI001556ED2B|nr:LysE family translocator [Campylobacter sp. RM16188]
MNYLLFIATFFPISLMPGINMTFILGLSMSIGYKRSFAMLLGQLFSVGFIASICIFGAGALLLKFEAAFRILKFCSALYIIYLGVMLFFSRGKLSVKSVKNDKNHKELFIKGLIVSISNPKAWIFLAAILPPFLNPNDPFGIEAYLLLFLLVFIEFICLNIYALGGSMLKKLLINHLRALEIATASLMCIVGVWMLSI